jgi:hypothetical protein
MSICDGVQKAYWVDFKNASIEAVEVLSVKAFEESAQVRTGNGQELTVTLVDLFFTMGGARVALNNRRK